MDWLLATSDEIDRGFAQFGGLRGAADAELCCLIQAVDARQSWMADGARSLSEWVSVRLRIRPETARLLVRVARRLVDLPHLSARLAAGDLSLDQVDAISRFATAETEELEVDEALSLSNAELDRRARRANPPTRWDDWDAYRRRAGWIQRNLDGSSGRLTAELPHVELDIVESRLRQEAEAIPPDPETGMFDPYPARLADALVQVCATTGDQCTVAPPQVTMHADLQALTTETGGVSELASGALVANDLARYLSCDCVVETVVSNDSIVIGVGRSTRTIPGWLRRLVLHRDGYQCRYPGCGNRRWLQVHHVVHWARGGTTDLDNLITLCGHHHRFIHTRGWHITREGGGTFTFRRPDHRPYPPSTPPLHPRLAKLLRPT